MQYREIGKTGKNASALGLGCEYLDGKSYAEIESVIKTALEHGVNILDVFMPGEQVRANIAKALGSRRGDVMIQGHIGSTDINEKYDICRDLPTVKKYFENLLRLFDGYIDFGMLFFIDSDEDYKKVFETDIADYAASLRAKGQIGHIGFSSHNPKTAMKAVLTGLPEMTLFSVNPAFDMLPPETYALEQLEKGLDGGLMRGVDPDRARFYKLCTQKQIGITTMKTLGAGKLLAKEHTPFAEPMTVWQCMSYALSRPAVASAMLGCKTPDEVENAMRYFDLNDEERDFSTVISTMRNDFKGSCVYCGHCQPCPAGIDIATVNKYLDIAVLSESAIPPSIKSHYLSLSKNGSDCSSCGSCEARCPFDVRVADNMAKAHALLA